MCHHVLLHPKVITYPTDMYVEVKEVMPLEFQIQVFHTLIRIMLCVYLVWAGVRRLAVNLGGTILWARS